MGGGRSGRGGRDTGAGGGVRGKRRFGMIYVGRLRMGGKSRLYCGAKGVLARLRRQANVRCSPRHSFALACTVYTL